MLGSSGAPDATGSGKKLVLCGDVEARVFGKLDGHIDDREGEESALGSGSGAEEPSSEDEGEEDSDGGVAIAAAGTEEPKGGREGDHTPQQLGRQRAANREKVRQAARRGVVFGFAVDGAGCGDREKELTESDSGVDTRRRRRVEAMQGGRVVEPSFAKGEWGVRWRDEYV